MPENQWISAAEALQLLQVRAQTLYANVSRGRVRARPDPTDPRKSRYHRGDVQRLAAARRGRRPAAAVAQGAIAWGDPVLASALSTVVSGRLVYRGRDAAELAARHSLEDVAEWLWQGPLVRPAPPDPNPRRPRQARQARPFGPWPPGDLPAALLAMAQRAAMDLPSLHRHPDALRADAGRVFHTLADALCGALPPGAAADLPVSARLAAAWGRPRAADVIRQALVWLADHELNASTFAARVTVSTGASLAAGVLSGLATLSGPLHGRASLGVEALLRDAEQLGAAQAIKHRLAEGRMVAAFGHPLYPQGDVRAAGLLGALKLPAAHRALARWGEELLGERPNVDFALSALRHAHGLPEQAPLVIFALARSVGWLAHGMEQAAARSGPLRPRARYVGPAAPAGAG